MIPTSFVKIHRFLEACGWVFFFACQVLAHELSTWGGSKGFGEEEEELGGHPDSGQVWAFPFSTIPSSFLFLLLFLFKAIFFLNIILTFD